MEVLAREFCSISELFVVHPGHISRVLLVFQGITKSSISTQRQEGTGSCANVSTNKHLAQATVV